MVCKTSVSSMFGDLPLTTDFICSVVGKPIMDNGKQIGIITSIDPKTDTLYMDIDDNYKAQFEKSCEIWI